MVYGCFNAMGRRLRPAALAFCLLTGMSAPLPTLAAANDDFIGSFISAKAQQQPQVLWINGALRQQAEAILGHRFASLRVRYWGEGERSLWILEEIGKEMPITIGVVVDGGRIAEVRILEYRESRGGEVRYNFFTDQFKTLTLGDEKDRLSGHIDGITGATLSVAAVRKIAILALVFHQHTPFGQAASH
jgi:hypothetical protein